MYRDHVDFIVEDACNQLQLSMFLSQGQELHLRQREKPTTIMSVYDKYDVSLLSDQHVFTHVVIQFVFRICHIRLSSIDEHDEIPLFLLKDMILNTMQHMDLHSVDRSTSKSAMTGMVQVLQVLAKSIVLPVRALEAHANRLMQCFPLYFQQEFMTEVHPLLVDQSEEAIHKDMQLYSLVQFDKAVVSLGLFDRKYAMTSEPLQSGQRSVEQKNSKIEDGLQDDDENDSDPTPSPSIQLLMDICERCGFCLSLPSLSAQLAGVETLFAATLRLTGDDRHLLPTIHRVWTFLSMRLKHLVDTMVSRTKAQFLTSSSSLASSTSSTQHAPTRERLEMASTSLDPNPRCVEGSILALMNSTDRHSQQSHFKSQDENDFDNSLYLLPSIWEYISLLVILTPKFIGMKLKDDLWPFVFAMLNVQFEKFVVNHAHQLTQTAQRSDKFRLDNKLKLALLQFMWNVLQQHVLFMISREKVKALMYLLLPWSSSNEVSEHDMT
jgi:hypothetical protein